MNTELLSQRNSPDRNWPPKMNVDWENSEVISVNFNAHLTAARPPLSGRADDAAQSPMHVQPSGEKGGANGRVLNILMVEDSQDDCDLICFQLKKCGCAFRIERVFCEETMRAALERNRWDVVFTDHGLPGFTGMAAIALLQQLELQIPVICITGSSDPAIIRKILAAGARACISKDDLSLLCRAVERAVSERPHDQ